MAYVSKNAREPDKTYIYKRVGGIDLPMQIYLPKDAKAKKNPALICIHGGAWEALRKTPEQWDGGWMRHQGVIAAEQGYVGIVITYRSVHLDGIDVRDLVADCADAYSFVTNLPYVDTEKITLIGDSAGGHLALELAFGGRLHPRAVIACNPVTDLTNWEMTGTPRVRDAASPLLHPVHSDTEYFFLHGDRDTVVPIADTVAMDEKLRALGCRSRMLTVKGASHAFVLYGYKTEDAVVDTYMEPILAFLDEVNA